MPDSKDILRSFLTTNTRLDAAEFEDAAEAKLSEHVADALVSENARRVISVNRSIDKLFNVPEIDTDTKSTPSTNHVSLKLLVDQMESASRALDSEIGRLNSRVEAELGAINTVAASTAVTWQPISSKLAAQAADVAREAQNLEL